MDRLEMLPPSRRSIWFELCEQQILTFVELHSEIRDTSLLGSDSCQPRPLSRLPEINCNGDCLTKRCKCRHFRLPLPPEEWTMQKPQMVHWVKHRVDNDLANTHTHARAHTHIHTHTHTHAHTRAHAHTHTHTHARTHARTSVKKEWNFTRWYHTVSDFYFEILDYDSNKFIMTLNHVVYTCRPRIHKNMHT